LGQRNGRDSHQEERGKKFSVRGKKGGGNVVFLQKVRRKEKDRLVMKREKGEEKGRNFPKVGEKNRGKRKG